MKLNDKEHQAFEAYREKQKLSGDMHPLHLIYLDGETQKHLEIFKAGYKANTPDPSASKVIEAAIYLKDNHSMFTPINVGDIYVTPHPCECLLCKAVAKYQKAKG